MSSHITIGIDIAPHLSKKSIFDSQKKHGLKVSKSIHLKRHALSCDKIIIEIPSNHFHLSPNFFFGFLYDIISTIGLNNFHNKFQFRTCEFLKHTIDVAVTRIEKNILKNKDKER